MCRGIARQGPAPIVMEAVGQSYLRRRWRRRLCLGQRQAKGLGGGEQSGGILLRSSLELTRKYPSF